MKDQIETIVAQATAAGSGGIGIIRVSGPNVPAIIPAILGKAVNPLVVNFCSFFSADKKIIDRGIALYFSAPRSFTGEDVLELQGHGGQVVMDLILQRILELGARLAKPGEFTERAFLNHKLDLVQAEAIADIINATTHQAVRSAARSLQGEFSQEIKKLTSLITELRVRIEAMIDFVEDEGVAKITNGSIRQDLAEIICKVGELKNKAKQGMILREGITAVITGDTNVGKSSLLNCLSGQETAIVTAIPGTTRDVLRAWIQLDGLSVNLLDTAGLRNNPGLIEAEGIRRAREEIKKADHILFMVDAATSIGRNPRELATDFLGEISERSHFTVLYNKIDLTGGAAKVAREEGVDCIYISVQEKQGLDLLKKHLKERAGLGEVDGVFSARRRHLEALECAGECLQNVENNLLNLEKIELLAEDLKKAQSALGDIIGVVTANDLLEKIFAEFCLGK
jgi:tRNA modification GTPase